MLKIRHRSRRKALKLARALATLDGQARSVRPTPRRALRASIAL